ncbi:hypothetical protein, partial [Parabacteroides goldsteinii]|uniref:hypothetical protein n=1 Tax=Parabacteroides goldsteinii TaxID=328812 RepID=UPI00248BCA18
QPLGFSYRHTKSPESLQNSVGYNALINSYLQIVDNSVIFAIISLFNLFLSNKHIIKYLITSCLIFLYTKTGRI